MAVGTVGLLLQGCKLCSAWVFTHVVWLLSMVEQTCRCAQYNRVFLEIVMAYTGSLVDRAFVEELIRLVILTAWFKTFFALQTLL